VSYFDKGIVMIQTEEVNVNL